MAPRTEFICKVKKKKTLLLQKKKSKHSLFCHGKGTKYLLNK